MPVEYAFRARVDRVADLPAYLDALDEWGVAGNEEAARSICDFLQSEKGLEAYREESPDALPAPPSSKEG